MEVWSPTCVFPTLPSSSEAQEGGTNGPLELETEKGLLQGGRSKETVAQLLPTHSSWEGFRRASLKVRLGGGGWGVAGSLISWCTVLCWTDDEVTGLCGSFVVLSTSVSSSGMRLGLLSAYL